MARVTLLGSADVFPAKAAPILREGREQDQGVGYLDDGTMIVVEAAGALVGSRVKAEVTSVLQSPSGKMIFTRVLE